MEQNVHLSSLHMLPYTFNVRYGQINYTLYHLILCQAQRAAYERNIAEAPWGWQERDRKSA